MKESFSEFQDRIKNQPISQWPSDTRFWRIGNPFDSAEDGPEIEVIRRELGDERFNIKIDWSSL